MGESGCTLDPLSRPLLCHTYLCDDLKTAIKKDAPEIIQDLREMFRTLDNLRSRLWSEYLDEQG